MDYKLPFIAKIRLLFVVDYIHGCGEDSPAIECMRSGLLRSMISKSASFSVPRAKEQKTDERIDVFFGAKKNPWEFPSTMTRGTRVKYYISKH